MSFCCGPCGLLSAMSGGAIVLVRGLSGPPRTQSTQRMSVNLTSGRYLSVRPSLPSDTWLQIWKVAALRASAIANFARTGFAIRLAGRILNALSLRADARGRARFRAHTGRADWRLRSGQKGVTTKQRWSVPGSVMTYSTDLVCHDARGAVRGQQSLGAPGGGAAARGVGAVSSAGHLPAGARPSRPSTPLTR